MADKTLERTKLSAQQVNDIAAAAKMSGGLDPMLGDELIKIMSNLITSIEELRTTYDKQSSKIGRSSTVQGKMDAAGSAETTRLVMKQGSASLKRALDLLYDGPNNAADRAAASWQKLMPQSRSLGGIAAEMAGRAGRSLGNSISAGTRGTGGGGGSGASIGMAAGGPIGAAIGTAAEMTVGWALNYYKQSKNEREAQIPARLQIRARTGKHDRQLYPYFSEGAEMGYMPNETLGTMNAMSGLGRGAMGLTGTAQKFSRATGSDISDVIGQTAALRSTGQTGMGLQESVKRSLADAMAAGFDKADTSRYIKQQTHLMSSMTGGAGSPSAISSFLSQISNVTGYMSSPERAGKTAAAWGRFGSGGIFNAPEHLAMRGAFKSAGVKPPSLMQMEMIRGNFSTSIGKGASSISDPGLRDTMGQLTPYDLAQGITDITGSAGPEAEFLMAQKFLPQFQGMKGMEVHEALKAVKRLGRGATSEQVKEATGGKWDMDFENELDMTVSRNRSRFANTRMAVGEMGLAAEAPIRSAASFAAATAAGINQSNIGKAFGHAVNVIDQVRSVGQATSVGQMAHYLSPEKIKDQFAVLNMSKKERLGHYERKLAEMEGDRSMLGQLDKMGYRGQISSLQRDLGITNGGDKKFTDRIGGGGGKSGVPNMRLGPGGRSVREDWAPYLYKNARNMGVDPYLADSTILNESSWNTNAVSPTGATGLGQFTQGTWGDHSKTSLNMRTDPKANIDALLSYLKDLKQRYKGNMVEGMVEYTGVKKGGATMGHVSKIFNDAAALQNMDKNIDTIANRPHNIAGEKNNWRPQ